jgi:hypothetical protein
MLSSISRLWASLTRLASHCWSWRTSGRRRVGPSSCCRPNRHCSRRHLQLGGLSDSFQFESTGSHRGTTAWLAKESAFVTDGSGRAGTGPTRHMTARQCSPDTLAASRRPKTKRPRPDNPDRGRFALAVQHAEWEHKCYSVPSDTIPTGLSLAAARTPESCQPVRVVGTVPRRGSSRA